jgi:ribosomal protein L34E
VLLVKYVKVTANESVLRYIRKLEGFALAAKTGSKLTSVSLAKSKRLYWFGVGKFL